MDPSSGNGLEDFEILDYYRDSWKLFTALEIHDEETIDRLTAQCTRAELVAGLALVASVLRQQLRVHARKVDCSCGSDVWLQSEVVRMEREIRDGE